MGGAPALAGRGGLAAARRACAGGARARAGGAHALELPPGELPCEFACSVIGFRLAGALGLRWLVELATFGLALRVFFGAKVYDARTSEPFVIRGATTKPT